MKVGDLVKFSEEFYPEKVMVDGRIHPFHVDTVDLEVIGYDDTKMIGGRL